MASFTLSLSGDKSELSADYFPPIKLDDGSDYVCALIDFQTYMAVPNINEKNNRFYFTKTYKLRIVAGEYNHDDIVALTQECVSSDIINPSVKIDFVNCGTIGIKSMKRNADSKYVFAEDFFYDVERLAYIEIPEGSYEIVDIENYLKKTLEPEGIALSLRINTNTLKSVLNCSVPVYFDREKNIGSVLGFNKQTFINTNSDNESDRCIKINSVDVFKIDCNIISGSYSNNKLSHTLHEFYPTVPAGYKVMEIPRTLIYLPVTVRSIHNISVRITDQNSELLNFRGENISLRIHIKKVDLK